MDCVDPNVLNGYAEGLLSAAEKAEVDGHLDQCAACRLALSALASVPANTHPSGEPVSLPAPGATFDRYRIEKALGEGGMGRVYLALDTKLRRRVALKVLHGDTADPEAVVRMMREARAAASLAHPNVVAIHELGEFGGHPFIVMEYVPGQSLRRLNPALPEVLEKKGDVAGACQAYKVVVGRWGQAKPRSVTADKAKARITALHCP